MSDARIESAPSLDAGAMFASFSGTLRIGDDVVVGPGVSVVPPVGDADNRRVTTIEKGAIVGGNAVIVAGVTIGRQARIEVGAVVETSVPDFAIVKGNPATIIGYTDTPRAVMAGGAQAARIEPAGIGGVSFHRMMTAVDMRGKLTVGEFEESVPFVPERYFLVYDVPSKDTRGEHAHRECHQFLVCVHGSVTCIVDDGSARREFVLSEPYQGLYMPPMIWGTQYQYSPGAVLLVFASHRYDPKDYIREYSTFLAETGHDKGARID